MYVVLITCAGHGCSNHSYTFVEMLPWLVCQTPSVNQVASNFVVRAVCGRVYSFINLESLRFCKKKEDAVCFLLSVT